MTGVRRGDVFGGDGGWEGLALEVESRDRPGLCLFAAEGRLLLVQGERPVLLAAVDDDHCGVEFRRTGAYRSVVPSVRAVAARETAGWPDRWAHRFAEHLAEAADGPLHGGRWLLARESPLLRRNHEGLPLSAHWGGTVVEGHPDGYVDWFVHNGSRGILPLRAMPDRGDARVKAYRKQARDGTLPPVLLWWIGGLDCHVVLDGHARLAAAVAESVAPPLLHLHRTAPGDEVAAGTERAVAEYEAELVRYAGLRDRHGPVVPDGAVIAGASLARRLEGLRTGVRPTWAWPLPGGRDAWERVAREAAGGGPSGWPGSGE
ncbi:hypothetical protein [Streptomyces cinereoruber]|uniref:hypothetical protein n=1 Tax=Streptomyces cinereoruber TaxID=67260 RepID=UPI00364F6ACB